MIKLRVYRSGRNSLCFRWIILLFDSWASVGFYRDQLSHCPFSSFSSPFSPYWTESIRWVWIGWQRQDLEKSQSSSSYLHNMNWPQVILRAELVSVTLRSAGWHSLWDNVCFFTVIFCRPLDCESTYYRNLFCLY